MKKLLNSKRLITFLCTMCIVSQFASSFIIYANSYSSSNLTNIQINNGKVITLTKQQLNDIVNITETEAREIALLFVRDISKNENVVWNESTKIVKVVPMYDQTDTDTITAYSIEFDEGYVVVSAYLDAASLIPEWSDKAKPLYDELDIIEDDEIIYLGSYEYYINKGEDKVTGLYGEAVEKKNLINLIEQDRSIDNIPEAAILHAGEDNISTLGSEIIDPVGHANANYPGPFNVLYRADWWENYLDYYDMSYGTSIGCHGHCTPTAITNLIAAFRNRYPADSSGIPYNNNSLFYEIADLGITNGYYVNSVDPNLMGTKESKVYNYIMDVFAKYNINPYFKYTDNLTSDIEDLRFSMSYGAIFYLSILSDKVRQNVGNVNFDKSNIYGDHGVILHGLTRLQSQADQGYKTYLHIADGWNINKRYLDLKTVLGCYIIGIQFKF